jgi:hypothetical protein
MEADPSVEYALPGSGQINMSMKYDEYWQTSWAGTSFSGSLSSSDDLTRDDIVHGRLPENRKEIVVDALILKRLQDDYSDIAQAGYKNAEDLIGRHLTLKNLPEFTIVGITDKKSPCIYADPSMFINMIANNGSEALDSSRLFDRFYTSGKKGSTGLGLALVKSIADSYNFKIEYSFKEGKHCFKVMF